MEKNQFLLIGFIGLAILYSIILSRREKSSFTVSAALWEKYRCREEPFSFDRETLASPPLGTRVKFWSSRFISEFWPLEKIFLKKSKNDSNIEKHFWQNHAKNYTASHVKS